MAAEVRADCASDSDCKGGRICVAGSCRRTCSADKDCPGDEVCEGNLCKVEGGTAPPTGTTAPSAPPSTPPTAPPTAPPPATAYPPPPYTPYPPQPYPPQPYPSAAPYPPPSASATATAPPTPPPPPVKKTPGQVAGQVLAPVGLGLWLASWLGAGVVSMVSAPKSKKGEAALAFVPLVGPAIMHAENPKLVDLGSVVADVVIQFVGLGSLVAGAMLAKAPKRAATTPIAIPGTTLRVVPLELATGRLRVTY